VKKKAHFFTKEEKEEERDEMSEEDKKKVFFGAKLQSQILSLSSLTKKKQPNIKRTYPQIT
jgi:hypothetical protein